MKQTSYLYLQTHTTQILAYRGRVILFRLKNGGCAMLRHYVYRIDHDTGFAPHAAYGWCLLCGCKKTTIERWAEPGSWVVGIGGNNTKTAKDKLIYAMQVCSTPSLAKLRRNTPRLTSYLRGHPKLDPASRVLVSRCFWYFGDRAQEPPRRLVYRGRNCKRLSDADVNRLLRFLSRMSRKGFKPGKLGQPNNCAPGRPVICGCRRGNAVSHPARTSTASHRCERH
jgi:hypothetical protein